MGELGALGPNTDVYGQGGRRDGGRWTTGRVRADSHRVGRWTAASAVLVFLFLVVASAAATAATAPTGHAPRATVAPSAGGWAPSAGDSHPGVDEPDNETTNGTAGEGVVVIGSVGNVTARGEDGTHYVWAGDRQSTALTVREPASMGFEYYTVCLSMSDEEGSSDSIACQRVAPGQSMSTLRMNWTPDEARTGRLVVTVKGGNQLTRQPVGQTVVPVQVIERGGDADSDKLSNERELEIGTNLSDTDTDDDGLMDGAEVTEYDTNPLLADTDADGVRDAVEIQQGTDPRSIDTDGDGLTDREEINGPTDPTAADTDGDGLEDKAEVEMGTDPTVRDTDADGLIDGVEERIGTSPTSVDSDGDMLSDGFERRLGTNPASPVFPAVLVVGLLGLAVGAAWAVRNNRAATPEDDDGGPGDGGDLGEEDGPLTDRDRIRQLLKQAGGRLKQARIVEETNWSKAKVSRVLSGMEDDGEISKIRIGRENLICLKGQEPDLARPSV